MLYLSNFISMTYHIWKVIGRDWRMLIWTTFMTFLLHRFLTKYIGGNFYSLKYLTVHLSHHVQLRRSPSARPRRCCGRRRRLVRLAYGTGRWAIIGPFDGGGQHPEDPRRNALREPKSILTPVANRTMVSAARDMVWCAVW